MNIPQFAEWFSSWMIQKNNPNQPDEKPHQRLEFQPRNQAIP